MTEGQTGDQPPLPPGWGLDPTPDLVTRTGGRILLGGAPFKIIRLSDRGAALTKSWFAGEPVGRSPQHQALARRLLNAGMAHPRPGPSDREAAASDAAADRGLTVTVVIPVKNDEEGLFRTLNGLQVIDPDGLGSDGSGPEVSGSGGFESEPIERVIVVDDGSDHPVTVRSPMVEVLRNERSIGPGPARQRALGSVTSDVVAFVDAGVGVTTGDLRALVDGLADEAVVAVAPRVRSSTPPESPSAVGRYEQVRSPLDLGPGQSLIGPGRMVPYVPTACLVARTSAVVTAGGFDPGLRYGEDVDLVWRLGERGSVRYMPQVEVVHPPRPTLPAMMRQRRGYGTAAGPLAARHGNLVAPCILSPWSGLVSGLMIAGSPVLALATVIGTGLALRPKIEPLPDVTVEAIQLTARGHWYGGLSLLTAAARTWSPALLACLVLLPFQRRRIAAVLLAGFGRRLLDGPRSPAAAANDVAIGALDDISYATGVWAGAIRERSTLALRPALTNWPDSDRND